MGWLTEQNDDVRSPEFCEDPLWWREILLLAVVEQRQNPSTSTGKWIKVDQGVSVIDFSYFKYSDPLFAFKYSDPLFGPLVCPNR